MALEHFIKKTNSLVDDQQGINNYSGMCVNEVESFTNHSAKWESSISMDHPDIQSFIERHNNMTPAPKDSEFERCMNMELPAKSEETKSKVKQDSAPTFNFNFTEEDFMEIEAEEPRPKTKSKSMFSFADDEDDQLKPFSMRPDTRDSSSPGFFSSAQSSVLSSSNNLPPRSAFVDKIWGKPKTQAHIKPSSSSSSSLSSAWKENNQGSVQPRSDFFRTAGQQLAIDKAKTGGGSISSDSYNRQARKQLGVNGPTASLKAAFKPPVRQNSNEGAARPTTHPPPDSNREALKQWCEGMEGVDTKMVELILQEVITKGSTGVTWQDVSGQDKAKMALHEMVVLPTLRPELFTGTRHINPY